MDENENEGDFENLKNLWTCRRRAQKFTIKLRGNSFQKNEEKSSKPTFHITCMLSSISQKPEYLQIKFLVYHRIIFYCVHRNVLFLCS